MNKIRLKKYLNQLSQFTNIPNDWDMSKKDERIQAVFDKVHGFDYFIKTYFPHYVRSPHRSLLHKYLFKILPEITWSDSSTRLAIAAPRGEAKSTLVTQLHTLYRIITGTTFFTVIVMDSINQAYPMLESIKNELENNLRLKADFPDVCGIGRVWQASRILTRNEIKIEVAGAGKRLRGLRHYARRPDLTILDDIENDKNVSKPEQRDKLDSWLSKTILPLGTVGEKYDILYIGTILHYDSVLNRTLNSPSWQTQRFKSVVRMPDNMYLWDEWEALYHAKELALADDFYRENKEEMDAGAIVSWEARPIYEMMKIRADKRHVFDSEYQNDPTAGDDAPFAKAIHYWHTLPNNAIYFGACDPSLGKKGASRDPSAIVVGAYHPGSGKLYIVKADIKKRLPDRIISDIIQYQKQFNCQVWAIESVQFQEFFRTELVKRSAELGVPVPARAVIPHSDKLLRIESLQPHMSNELLLLHQEQSTLIDQFRHFPKADHDDGCDAVEMVWKLAVGEMSSAPRQAVNIVEPGYFQ